MTIILIIIGIALLGIIIFRAGGKEIDKAISARGGFKTIYADVIRVLSSPANSAVTEKTPSNIFIEGKCQIKGKLCDYKWRLYTLDGRKLTIKFLLNNSGKIAEEKVFDFPMNTPSVEILATLHNLIENKAVFPK